VTAGVQSPPLPGDVLPAITAYVLAAGAPEEDGTIMNTRSTQGSLHRRTLIAAAAVVALAPRAMAQEVPQDDPWPSLARQIFGGRTLRDGAALLTLEAPYRAEDAAVVPITTQLGGASQVHKLTLVIDQNPSPLAAAVTLGADSGIEFISTRVRVDSYTNVHAVAEMGDGGLFATKRFVKAAGGCSAPAAKAEASAIPLGTMRFRQFPPIEARPELREAQLLIHHPNHSGMQMDQLTRLYVPAHFITAVRIWQGDDVLLSIESGISIAENPEYRFNYRPNGASVIRAEAHDSKGATFKDEWPVARV
jgi:sulfur-oxidizing protein SoxY